MNLKLKFKIIESNKRQIALARELGITETQLSKFINEWAEPDSSFKQRIAESLGCPVEEIFPTKEQAA